MNIENKNEAEESITRIKKDKEFIPNIYQSKMEYQKDNKEYILQMSILNELKKLKINLHVNEANKKEIIFTNTFTLSQLISRNKFFERFNNFLEAFNYLLNNCTKVEKTNIISDNKEISLLLLFSINEIDKNSNNNGLNQERIEFNLYSIGTTLNKSKSYLKLTSTIHTLKSTLEKFNSSINEIKSNMDNDKIDKNNMMNELENIINSKIKELKNDININELMLKIKNIEEKNNKEKEEKNFFGKKLEEIYSKMKEYDHKIIEMTIKIEENEKKCNINFNRINECDIYSYKIEELFKKLNNLEENIIINNEKAEEMEINMNNKFSNFKEKVNSDFKKLASIPSNNNSKTSSTINNEENIKFDEIINKKINDRMKLYEEKVQILSKKVFDLENRNQNKQKNKNEESMFKDYSYIEFKINELEEKLNKKEMNKSILNSDKKNNNSIIYIDNKTKSPFDNKNKEADSAKIKEIYSMLNQMNEKEKEDYKELSNKILCLKSDLIRTIETKNLILDNKFKSCFEKINTNEKGNKALNILNKTEDKKLNKTAQKIKSPIESPSKNPINSLIKSPIKSPSRNPINVLVKSPIKGPLKSQIKSPAKTYNSLYLKMKNYDLNKSLNMNDSYIMKNQKVQSYSPYEEEEEPKNINMSFSIYRDPQIKFRLYKGVIETYIDSKIFKREEITDDHFLFSKIKEIYQYNKYIRLALVFRSSRDGGSAKTFHMKCDSIGPNLTIIKTKRGFIFGGFTIKNWKHLYKDIKKEEPENGTEHKDEKAFTFCMNNKKIYKNGKINENVIYCNNNCCVCFKTFFKVYDDFYKNGGICGRNENKIFMLQEKDYEFNGGEPKFNIEEMEIFQILFK